MVKQLLGVLFVLIMLMGFSLQSNATLYDRGTDSLGNKLIYDSGFNLTWYDYTASIDTWQNQMNWASGLTVNFGGITYDDWSLASPRPRAGTNTCYGFCGDGEMGHLYYDELGNLAGNAWTPGGGLRNLGPFEHLEAHWYWGSQVIDPPGGLQGVAFNFGNGEQGHMPIDWDAGYGFAVRIGDVPQQPIAPEPISSILFVTGGAILIGRKYIRRKKTEV